MRIFVEEEIKLVILRELGALIQERYEEAPAGLEALSWWCPGLKI